METEVSPRVFDAARLAAVRATSLLDAEPEAAFDTLTTLAASLLGAPFAFMTLVDDERSYWMSRFGIEDPATNQNKVEESFCQYVIASGEPLIVGDVTANAVTADNPSIESMGVAAWAGYPLQGPDGQVLGSFCVVDTVRREWTERDVEILAVLASSAGRELALRSAVGQAEEAIQARDDINVRLRSANARISASARHDRSVARILQDAMLTQLPEPDHLHLLARYLTADGTDQVGGDWYDALIPSSGASTLIIGDVAGHDIAAATVMGQLRNMLRAFAWEHPESRPSELIERLDRAMWDFKIQTMTTLAVMRIEQTAAQEHTGMRTIRWSNAGHPSPLLVDAAGKVLVLAGEPDVPLGIRPDGKAARTDHSRSVEPGSTLLLYTDGLVETRDLNYEVRLRQLVDVVTSVAALPLDEMLDAVLEQMSLGAGQDNADDIALLAVRFHPQDEPRPPEASPADC